MKTIIFLISILLLISCSSKNKQLISRLDKIEKIEVYKGFPQTQENKVEMQDDFKSEFIKQIKKAKKLPPTKFPKPYSFVIYRTDNTVDTVLTNGKIYQSSKWFETKENLIDKYKK